MNYIRRFAELGIADVPLVGGKNASLGEMYQRLSQEGIKVPNGFAITAEAYRHYIRHNVLDQRIGAALNALDIRDVQALATTGAKIRQWVIRGEMPADLAAEIRAAYKALAAEYGPSPDVAVRSSATAEDLPTASFAGQHETYLNIHGAERVVEACRRCFASLFTDRAISYRIDKGFDHFSIALSVGVMKMVRSDLASSGVLFTIDTETGFEDVVFITGAYGLGETVVQGVVDPDEFYVHKPTFELGHRSVLKRKLGRKQVRMVYSQGRGGQTTSIVPTPDTDRDRFCLTDTEVLTLAGYGIE